MLGFLWLFALKWSVLVLLDYHATCAEADGRRSRADCHIASLWSSTSVVCGVREKEQQQQVVIIWKRMDCGG